MKRYFGLVVGLALVAAAVLYPSSIGKPAGGTTVSVGTFAQISASTPADGTIGSLTNSYYDQALRDAGVWRYFTDGREMFPITLGSYTPVNVGSTTNNTTNGSVTLFANSVAAGAITAYMKAAPAATFTVRGQGAMTQYATFGNQGGCLAVAVGDGTKFETIGIFTTGIIYVARWSTSTSFSADVFTTDVGSTAYLNNARNVFFRVVQDATNLIYSISSDGQNWFTVYTEAKGAFFTTQASQVGFAIDLRGSRNTTCTYTTLEVN